ncbi:patatin-like phospholipase family protein [Williamsia sterculiae]|uniref:NTE family protein n=1 Tax=Williamsia sterculiae TaxID=1344003 RepID=A0A1N7DG31_9NOCA|nr:patatin-like phospholipase family protein [Williamsia sterculiae]SIR74849.1 NTE family protein [Williamsia sterculiae]
MTTRALVLGGGGITGTAWQAGMLCGLAKRGVDLTEADLIVGTSAGSVTGALLRSGIGVEELYDMQQRPPLDTMDVHMSLLTTLRLAVELLRSGRDEELRGRRLGRWALDRAVHPDVPTAQARFAAMRARRVPDFWPDGALHVAAVDAQSGALRVFTRDDGVPLHRAVAASCAIPGAYTPVEIDGHRYVDGGARSSANADLARGHDRVVVLAPIDAPIPFSQTIVRQLRRIGATTDSMATPDRASRRAIGRDYLDHSRRGAAATAGVRQADADAERFASMWN